MKPPMTATQRCCRPAAFTLLEILVACSLSVLLLGILAAVASHSIRLAQATHSRLAASHEAEMALDYLARDIAGIMPPGRDSSTLALLPEAVPGPSGASAASCWMMMLCRPPSQAERGAFGAISYRLLYLDPLVPGGSGRSFGLYRYVLSPEETATNLAGLSDLYTGYWKGNWAAHLSQDNGRAVLGDYLAGNIVEIKATFRYRDLTGKLQELTPGQQVNWTYLGLAVNGDPAPETAQGRQPESVEIALTLLRPEGAAFFDAGILSLDAAIQRYGVTASRLIRLPASAL